MQVIINIKALTPPTNASTLHGSDGSHGTQASQGHYAYYLFTMVISKVK